MAAGILAALDRSHPRYLIAAHPSGRKNTVALAEQALAGGLGAEPIEPVIAGREDGFSCLWVWNTGLNGRSWASYRRKKTGQKAGLFTMLPA